MQADSPVAIVGLNMGGPANLGEVRPFLRALFADRRLVQLPMWLRPLQGVLAMLVASLRAGKMRNAYAQIGGGSPLLATTEAQVRGVAALIAAAGQPAQAFASMRYTAPRAEATARALAALKPRVIVLLSLYPQYSEATTGSSLEDIKRAMACEPRLAHVPLVIVDRFGTLPGYVHASAALVRRELEDWADEDQRVLFSAHGVPESYIRRGDPYEREVRASFELMRAELPESWRVELTFQSRVGPARWLGPATLDRLRALGAAGEKKVAIVPLAFVSDHIETLFELDIDAVEQARAAGVSEIRRVSALNTEPIFLRALAELVRERVAVLEPAA
jgi:ferrochelatase